MIDRCNVFTRSLRYLVISMCNKKSAVMALGGAGVGVLSCMIVHCVKEC